MSSHDALRSTLLTRLHPVKSGAIVGGDADAQEVTTDVLLPYGQALRTSHLDHARRARERGDLLLAGAFADPVDGAVPLFRGTSPAVAESFAKSDPYVTNGLVTRWHVREWTTVAGALMPVDSAKAEVVRMWRGATAPGEDAERYLVHLTDTVIPELGEIPGYRGARVLSRSIGSAEEFVVTTRWSSLAAGREFDLTGMRTLSDNAEHFSDRSEQYADFRPSYPPALVESLADLTPRTGSVWDAGCGSGQLSVALGTRFEKVIATDASQEQLSRAVSHPRVEYQCAPAERSGLPDRSVDLAVAAQAPVLAHFYDRVLEGYWPPERRHVDQAYRSLPFPFDEIPGPEREINVSWSLHHVMGYVETWSAVRALEAAEGRAAIDRLRRELMKVWGASPRRRRIAWPLAVRLDLPFLLFGMPDSAGPKGPNIWLRWTHAWVQKHTLLLAHARSRASREFTAARSPGERGRPPWVAQRGAQQLWPASFRVRARRRPDWGRPAMASPAGSA